MPMPKAAANFVKRRQGCEFVDIIGIARFEDTARVQSIRARAAWPVARTGRMTGGYAVSAKALSAITGILAARSNDPS